MAKNTYRWKTQYNAHTFKKWAEPNSGMPSMTVPDLTLTIEEILARSARGLTMEQMLRVPIWEGQTEAEALKNYMPDVMHMDPVDQEAYKRSIDEKINIANKRRTELIKLANEAKAKLKAAHQGSKVQRTTGDADDQGSTDEPDNPISAKNRPAGEANTRGISGKNKSRSRGNDDE